MPEPRVGIAIANRNKARFLPVCLDSIIRQTYANLEIVVVDDCSTDDSVEVLERYADRNQALRIIRNAAKVGVAAARNRAIEALDADWITTLDSDDFYCHPDKLSAEITLATASSARQIAAFSGIALVNAAGRRLFLRGHARPVAEGRIFERLLARDCLIPRDFVFARRWFDEVGGFDSSLPLYEDWDFKLRLSRILDFSFTGIVGVAYRQGSHGLSSARAQMHRDCIERVFARYVDLAGDPNQLRSVFERNVASGWQARLLNLLRRARPA